MTPQPALRLERITKSYGTTPALDTLSFDAELGRFCVLFGPSGVGKTTTLRTIAGLIAPDSGSIFINGVDAASLPPRKRGIAMVFQSFALYPHLTVAQNFAYPLKEAGVAPAEIRTRVGETAEMLRLSHRLSNKPGTLSGGEQQRTALGRALIGRPKILLLDEPLTNLDAKLRHDMRAELKRLHRQFGMTIIYATPDELEALTMGEEIAVLDRGHVVQHGTPDVLYDQPINTYVAAKIGSPHMNLLPATVAGSQSAVTTPFGEVRVTHPGLSQGMAVTLGLRPTDLTLAGQSSADFHAKVHLVEPLGDVTLVSLETAGPVLRMLLPEERADGITNGDALAIKINSERAYLFHEASGAAINRAA
ncbi:MAG: ABC transporter ATP-binding protein [Pseudomonadota bacterium]